jgi:hypothetical protein
MRRLMHTYLNKREARAPGRKGCRVASASAVADGVGTGRGAGRRRRRRRRKSSVTTPIRSDRINYATNEASATAAATVPDVAVERFAKKCAAG